MEDKEGLPVSQNILSGQSPRSVQRIDHAPLMSCLSTDSDRNYDRTDRATDHGYDEATDPGDDQNDLGYRIHPFTAWSIFAKSPGMSFDGGPIESTICLQAY